MTYEELCGMANRDLEAVFRRSKAPDPARIAGWEWRGFNTPVITVLLGIRKFIKGFFARDGRLEGYNIPARQNGFAEPWLQKPSPEAPHRFGFYLVDKVDPGSADNRYPDALLLDYGASPRNAWYRIEKVLRDYLVQPDPKNPDLLLGKAYIALGPFRIPSSFFVLERLREAPWTP